MAKSSTPTNDLWVIFKETLTAAINKYIPHRTVNPRSHLPWITADLRQLINAKNKLYRKMKKTGNKDLRDSYKNLKRHIQRETRRKYWDFLNGIFTDTEGDHENLKNNKKFWSYIKAQKSSSNTIAPLKKEGRLTSDPLEQAEILNSQFHSVFGDGKVYTRKEFYLKTNMKDPEFPKMKEISISYQGVLKMLLKLNPHKACGPDGITSRILKELAQELAPGLTAIFQSSLDSGTLPADWKRANVTPIYKKGEQYKPENYRPVSLTCITCKLLEHIMVSAMMTHFENNNILTQNQHGFRRQRSCETQLLEFTDELFTKMEEGQQTDVLIMDFAKAFDTVNHSLLLHKLKNYGVNSTSLRWIENFLSGRSQVVVVGGSASSSVPVKSGVPQGSVLGPCLFLAYINDLPDNLSSTARLFADDTAVYTTVGSNADAAQLQQDLLRLEKWETSWDMSFHPSKCITLPITRKRQPTTSSYQLHGHTLQTVPSAKYLGITITSKLDWDEHISNTVTKSNRALGFLRRNLKISSRHIKEKAYKAYVRPLMEYSATVWDPQCQKNIDRLETIQRRAARFVLNRYRNTSSVSDMLSILQWPSLQQRRQNARLTMMFKIFHQVVQCPHIREKQQPAPDRERRGHPKQLNLIKTRTNYHSGAFLPRTIKEWNKLPCEIVMAKSAEDFVSALRLSH